MASQAADPYSVRMTTTCRICGTTIPGGTLLAHTKAAHPKPAVVEPKKRGYVCRQPKCCEFYGPVGHMLIEGPHTY